MLLDSTNCIKSDNCRLLSRDNKLRLRASDTTIINSSIRFYVFVWSLPDLIPIHLRWTPHHNEQWTNQPLHALWYKKKGSCLNVISHYSLSFSFKFGSLTLCVTPLKCSIRTANFDISPFFLPPFWNLLLEHAYSVFSRDISNAGMMMVPSVIFVHIRCNSSLRVIRVIGCRGNWWTSWEFRALLILIICPLMIFGLNGMSQVCRHVYPSSVVIVLFRRNV